MRCAEIDTAAAPTPDRGKQPPVVIVEDRIGITASVTVRRRIVVVVAPWHALTEDLLRARVLNEIAPAAVPVAGRQRAAVFGSGPWIMPSPLLRRVVAAGDDGRERIERDLRDGVRRVASGLRIRLAATVEGFRVGGDAVAGAGLNGLGEKGEDRR